MENTSEVGVPESRDDREQAQTHLATFERAIEFGASKRTFKSGQPFGQTDRPIDSSQGTGFKFKSFDCEKWLIV